MDISFTNLQPKFKLSTFPDNKSQEFTKSQEKVLSTQEKILPKESSSTRARFHLPSFEACKAYLGLSVCLATVPVIFATIVRGVVDLSAAPRCVRAWLTEEGTVKCMEYHKNNLFIYLANVMRSNPVGVLMVTGYNILYQAGSVGMLWTSAAISSKIRSMSFKAVPKNKNFTLLREIGSDILGYGIVWKVSNYVGFNHNPSPHLFSIPRNLFSIPRNILMVIILAGKYLHMFHHPHPPVNVHL